MFSVPSVVSSTSAAQRPRRRRSVSRERTEDEDELTRRSVSRRRELSPQPRSKEETAHRELHSAIPSLQEDGAELESQNCRQFVRTLIKKKPEWSYGELHALARVTSTNNRLTAWWDFDHGNLIIDWFAAERPRRDLGLRRSQAGAASGLPISLSREVLDVIKAARCDAKVYIVVVNAVSLLYEVRGARTAVCQDT